MKSGAKYSKYSSGGERGERGEGGGRGGREGGLSRYMGRVCMMCVCVGKRGGRSVCVCVCV